MKKQKIVACSAILLFFFGIALGYSLNKNANKNEQPESPIKNKIAREAENIDKETYKNEIYYIITGDYEGEYQLEKVNLIDLFDEEENNNDKVLYPTTDLFNVTDIYTYDEYKAYMSLFDLKTKYTDEDKKYLVVAQCNRGSAYVSVRVADVVVKDKTINLYMYERFGGVTADVSGYVLVIPLDKDVEEYNITTTYTKEEFKNIKKYGYITDPHRVIEEKPMIYIYPEEEMEVNVELGNKELLTTTYPKYNDGWKVVAAPDGTLKYNGREYYGLYWEGEGKEASIKEDGFIVKGEDVESFLEEKLAILGLNEREANEFIVYWLPRLESNKYNYIRFETKEEIDDYMPLIVSPTPDSVIRIIMDFKGLDETIEVKEQELETPTRTGYTVVEWGGVEIK